MTVIIDVLKFHGIEAILVITLKASNYHGSKGQSYLNCYVSIKFDTTVKLKRIYVEEIIFLTITRQPC
jgi:hypothetical protein